MSQATIAVIGGTGLYQIEGMTDIREIDVDTPYGATSDSIIIGNLNGTGIAFLPRHGRGHRIQPSAIPNRANIYALKTLVWSISSPSTPAAALRTSLNRGLYWCPTR